MIKAIQYFNYSNVLEALEFYEKAIEAGCCADMEAGPTEWTEYFASFKDSYGINWMISGMVAKMSPMFPKKGIDITEKIHELPADVSATYMPDFEWVHTQGHTKGHISLYREKDKALIAGDAFITVK